MSETKAIVWGVMLLFAILPSVAQARQDPTSPEAVRAEQNALRNGVDRTVTVTIGPGPTTPAVVGDKAPLMPLEPDERLVIHNASAGIVWLRFADGSLATMVNDTISLPSGQSQTLAPVTLTRLAGPDQLLLIQVVDPSTPSTVLGTMRFLILGTTLETEERADEVQVRAAQAAVVRPRVDMPRRGVPPPSGKATPPFSELNLDDAQVRTALQNKARPLPVERIVLNGEPVGESLRLRSDSDKKVIFLKDDKTVAKETTVSRGKEEVLSYEEIADWAGRDGNLEFTVDAGTTGTWSGHLTVNVEPLQTGRLVVPIDLTGVSDWRFVNPRLPARIGPERRGVPLATLEFANRVPGRTIKVTFPSVARDPFQKDFETAGFQVSCKLKVCTPELVLQAANRRVNAKLLVDAYGGDKEGLVEFKVAFFEGDIEPANTSGYLAVVLSPIEPGFSTTWNAVGNAGFLRDAHFAGFTMSDTEAPVINTATPFNDHARWHMTGSVRLSARPQLGTRANAEVDLIVKDKDFGLADAPSVTTQKARVNVFGFNGFSMSVGRFDFAAPTRSIAIAESGEGISGRWRRFTVSHVIRPREKLDKGVIPVSEGAKALVAASPDLRDRWSTLAQTQWAPCWLRLETSTLIGRRKTLQGAEGLYFTWGGDLMAAGGFGGGRSSDTSCRDDEASDRGATEPATTPAAVWRLNGGFYSSHRQAKASAVGATEADGGWVGLVDGTIARMNGHDPRLTVGATIAMASRDDPATSQSEGYAGESGAFVPDKIFLATLAGKVVPLAHVETNGETQGRPLSGGLTGKKYVGAGFVYQGFSPLQWLAQVLQVPATDVTTKSVTVRWHGYSLQNPVVTDANSSGRSWLGQETSMEWLLESPRGVRYTVTGAYFAPGSLLKAQQFVLSSTWYVDARVTVTLR